MEDRKYVKFLVLIFVSGVFIFQGNIAFAYSTDTHAYLTSEILKFYNQNFPNNKILDELGPYLIDGSRREDDTPRWMNHFYDPVNNQGLKDSVLGIWQKSKDWAQDGNNQNSATYKVPATIASILTAIQQGSIRAITDETDFTWQRAIKFYVAGDEEKAIFILGHVLHLMEDMSVPEHTRNDAHVSNNPYESYTKQFSVYAPDTKLAQRLIGKGPISFGGLDSYFDNLANYSNNNFYSAETIGVQSGYAKPEPDYTQKDGDYFYGFIIDSEDGPYRIFIKEKQGLFNTVVSMDSNIKLLLNKEKGSGVLSDYWSLLSVKSIQYGAGVIDLFFKEAEAAKNDPNFDSSEETSILVRAVESVGNFVAQVRLTLSNVISSTGDFLSDVFNGGDDFEQIEQVDLEQGESQNENIQVKTDDSQLTAVQKINTTTKDPGSTNEISNTAKQDEETLELEELAVEEEQEIEDPQKVNQKEIQQSASVNKCSFSTSQFPSRQKIAINEIAWMGTSNSANDEWIELKNISNENVDVGNWQLLDKEEQIKINFASMDGSKIVGSGQFVLLERTDDNSVPGIKANLIYSGALSNSNEGLRLFDKDCNLIDEVLASPDWPAGNSADRKTMERNLFDFNWHTSGVANGTPKAENSVGQTQPQAQTTYSGGGASVSNSSSSQQDSLKILINEIQISPAGSRFIKLYNPNSSAVDLTNWYVQRKTKTSDSFSSLVTKTNFENKTISAKGYLLVSRSSPADVILDGLTLTESNTIQLKNSNGDVVDKVGWGAANDCEGNCAVEPAENQSIIRKIQNGASVDTDSNISDFEIKIYQAGGSNQAPSAFFDYSPKSAQAGQTINFNASSSTSPISAIISYQWDFGDGGTFISANPTASHSYFPFGNYQVNLVVFDSNGTSSTPATANIAVSISEANHVVISEIFFDAQGSDEGKEFVELYNPTNDDINLADYSLEILRSGVTSTDNLAKFGSKPEDRTTIKSKSFLLVGLYNYSGNVAADMTRSATLSNSSATVYLLNASSGQVDAVSYNNIDAGQSLERKAWIDSACALSQESDEFSGNSCDSNGDNDFDIRNTPNPQNSLSLPEPRSAPGKLQNFSVQYNRASMKFNFAWSESQDYSGATSTLVYKIFNATNPSSTLKLTETSSTSATVSVNEIGRDYQFSIQAFDGDGLGSDAATSSINIPSFLSGLYFYQNPKNSSENLIEARYGQYPFVPDVFNKGEKWKLLVFYLNTDAQGDLNNASWQPNDLSDVLGLKFNQCGGGTSSNSLILADTASYCSLGGGASGAALSYSQLEDNVFVVRTAKSNQELNLDSTGYITAAFYSVSSIPTFDGTTPEFELVALDKTKYYFGQQPIRQGPTLSGNITASFDKVSSKLNLSWQDAIDPDTLDSLLAYEIKYNEIEQWQSIGILNNASRFVLPGDSFNVSVRAKDDYDNYSATTLSLNWSYPPVDFSLEQNSAADWTSFGNSSIALPCFVHGLQSIQLASDISFDTLMLKIKRAGAEDFSSDLTLSVLSDNAGAPDFNNKIAESAISGVSAGADGQDYAFGFSPPINFTAGSTYWFSLSSSHTGFIDWTSNYWRNALGYNTAINGGAGNVCVGSGGNVYETTFSVNPVADWYMKFGLQR